MRKLQLLTSISIVSWMILVLMPAAQAAPQSQALSIDVLAHSTLQFIAKDQIARGDGIYLSGEWPTRVSSTIVPLMAGVGNPTGSDPEPSAFTTASVANQLAVIFIDHPEFSQIPSLIHKAVPTLARYEDGELYNFYPSRIWNGVRVHQTEAMFLLPMWKGLTNIPQDADTTSVSYAARYYDHLFRGVDSSPLPATVLKSFSTYRDLKRAPEYYDANEGLVNSGAFMTWQYDENDPRMPRFYFAGPEAGTRIPFNHNDVDCIVNMNVLRVLALTKNSQLPGRTQSCNVLKYFIDQEKYSSCGIYYPNTYNFAYSAALVDEAGETCLTSHADKMVRFILRHQAADGGWFNDDNLWLGDRVHATAFALFALARFGDPADTKTRQALLKARQFLGANLSRSPSGDLYWKGEVFFTATAIARSLVNWRSDSFTTAVALSALLKTEKFLRTPIAARPSGETVRTQRSSI